MQSVQPDSILVFFGLVILAVVNFLGFRQLARTLEAGKPKS